MSYIFLIIFFIYFIIILQFTNDRSYFCRSLRGHSLLMLASYPNITIDDPKDQDLRGGILMTDQKDQDLRGDILVTNWKDQNLRLNTLTVPSYH